MVPSKNKKHIKPEQKDKMVSFMLVYKDLATGKLSGNNYKEKSVSLLFLLIQLTVNLSLNLILPFQFTHIFDCLIIFYFLLFISVQDQLYAQLTNILNAVEGGAVKDVESWKKVKLY